MASLPASGSERQNEPIHSPAAIRGKYFSFCKGLPKVSKPQQIKELFPAISYPKIEQVIAPFETISTVEDILAIIDEMKLLYIASQNKDLIALNIFDYLLEQHELTRELYLQIIHNDATEIIMDKLKRIRWGLGLEKQIN